MIPVDRFQIQDFNSVNTMKLQHLLGLALILALVSCTSTPSSTGTRFQSSASDPSFTTPLKWVGKNGREYGLYVPSVSKGRRIPVVMFLHGYTGDPIAHRPWVVDGLNQREPCAVFAPVVRPEGKSDDASGWGGTYDKTLRPAMVEAIAELDRVISEYDFDRSRQSVYGESMGAEGVFMLLAQYPERFSSAVAVAGYTLNKDADKMAKTPLWILHGSADTAEKGNDVSSSRNIHQAILKAGGTKVLYTEYSGLDHMGAIRRAAVEPGLCEWMLGQRRR